MASKMIGTEIDVRQSLASGQDVQSLLREIQAGKAAEENFGQIFDRFCGAVTHFFTNRGFSEHEAEELAQDVFVRVYRNIGAFRFESSFETWLFRIVGNVWKNELRSIGAFKRKAEKVPLDGVVDGGDEENRGAGLQPRDGSEGPLEQVLAGERSRILERALEELPPKMRQCMVLRIGEELKYREIAVVMQVSIATVKSQLSEGHKRLKPILENQFEVFSV